MRSHIVLAEFPFAQVEHVLTRDWYGATRMENAGHVGIPGTMVRRYCDVTKIMDGVRHAFSPTESVGRVSNTAEFLFFSPGESRYSSRDMGNTFSRLVLVLEAARRGGDMVVKPCIGQRVVLTPTAGMAVLLSNLTEFDITAVMGGKTILAVIELDIAAMRSRITTIRDTVYANSGLVFEKPTVRDVFCVFQIVVDASTKEQVAERVLLNGQWHNIVKIISSGDRVHVPAERDLHVKCTLDHVPMTKRRENDGLLARLAAIEPPYADACRQTCVYGSSPKVCTVYSVYARLLGGAV